MDASEMIEILRGEKMKNKGRQTIDLTNRKKVVHVSGKRYRLPEALPFEHSQSLRFGGDFYFYNVVGFREPKAGEYFLSGALVGVYLTHHDLTKKYLVVEKTSKVIRRTTIEWVTV